MSEERRSDAQRALIASLRGTRCPACEKRKYMGKSFCFSCWNRLPSALRQPLYRKFGEGYEEAHAAAMAALAGTAGGAS